MLTDLFRRLLVYCCLGVHGPRLCSVEYRHIFIIFIVLLERLQFQLVIRHCYQPVLASLALLPVKAAHNHQSIHNNSAHDAQRTVVQRTTQYLAVFLLWCIGCACTAMLGEQHC